MKYSLQWLNGHIEGTLPSPEKLIAEITEKAFEVEGTETYDDDTVIEAKVLPDRAHDALCHRGMAREIAALFGLKRKEIAFSWPEHDRALTSVRVRIEDPDLCMRYIGILVEGVSPKESPKWLKKRLEAVGQRSINSIVDITNFVMFDIGQPMHAFDAKKVKGGITIRLAKKGETMTTLDNKTLAFDGTEQVIADDEGILALAGVKGGKKAEVDENTTAIILESANFQPTLTRRISTKHNIKTDASKRYENGISSVLAEEGAKEALALIKEFYPDAKAATATDEYPEREDWQYVVGVSLRDVNALLGSAMNDGDIRAILERGGYAYVHQSPREIVQELLETCVGKAYRNPSAMRHDAPNSFSCSSLVSYLFAKAGIWMPSLSIDKLLYGREMVQKDLRFGDLVFSNTQEGHIYTKGIEYQTGMDFPAGVDHVGIFLGEGRVIHASKATNGVAIESLASAKQFANIVGFRRMVDDIDEPRYIVTISPERLDLRRSHDLIEEIGRQYGYNRIKAVTPKMKKKGKAWKRLHYSNRVRSFLVERGYSEVYTYSFAKKGQGDVEVMNPVGEDRPFVRSSMSGGFRDALEINRLNAPLIGVDKVKIFEFGNVFPKGEEHFALALGIAPAGEKALKEIKTTLADALVAIGAREATYVREETNPRSWAEVDFDAQIELLSEPNEYEPFGTNGNDTIYRTVSTYPFIARDIAVFVPENVQRSELEDIIKKNAGDLVVRFSQFDKFQRPGEDRVSYAYRLVFQSFERTLTDEEVNGHMERVYAAIAKHERWQVR